MNVKFMSIANAVKDMEYFDNVIIDLWSSKDRVPDAFGGIEYCSHNYTDGNYCKSCGAYVGMIGLEINELDFYKHMYYISNLVNTKNLYILTKRVYAPNYELKTFGMKVDIDLKKRQSSLYTIFDSVVTASQELTKDVSQRTVNVIHFTTDSNKLWKNKVIYNKDLSLIPFLEGSVRVINPSLSFLKKNFSFSFDYITPNTKIFEEIKRVHL